MHTYCAFNVAAVNCDDHTKNLGFLMDKSGKWKNPVVTEIVAASDFWSAEEYHQDFFERNPYQGYCMAVAAPKVAKFRQTFARLVRD